MSDVDGDTLRLLEALLFASAEGLSERALATGLPEGSDVEALLGELRDHYDGRGVHLVCAGKTWAFRTAPDLATRLAAHKQVARKLSRAGIETLAIIAYHQPVTRAEIEEIRGVGLSRGTLDSLLEAGWIRPRGRRRTPGRPTTWGTTDAFLDHFGLESTEDLPGTDELKAAGLLDSRPAIDAHQRREVQATLALEGAAEGEAAAAYPDDEDAEPIDDDAELIDEDAGQLDEDDLVANDVDDFEAAEPLDPDIVT
jgi:segregation and condensation protein B